MINWLERAQSVFRKTGGNPLVVSLGTRVSEVQTDPAIPVSQDLETLADPAASVTDPAVDARRERVLAMLDRSPGIKHALITDTTSDPEDVILTVGIRDLGTAELRIPKAKYEPFAIMKAVETLQ